MIATLQTIDAGIFATLESLLASTGTGPFASVQRFASPLTGRDQERQLNTEALGQTPALLLAFETETYAIAPGSLTVPGQQNAFVGSSIHRVFISHTELAGHDSAIIGQVDAPGILELVSLTVARLSGLRIPGLYRRSRLQPIDAKPVLVKPGAYIYLARFRADRFIDGVAVSDASVPMEDSTATIQPKAQDGTGALIDGEPPVTITLDLSE